MSILKRLFAVESQPQPRPEVPEQATEEDSGWELVLAPSKEYVGRFSATLKHPRLSFPKTKWGYKKDDLISWAKTEKDNAEFMWRREDKEAADLAAQRAQGPEVIKL